MAASVKQSYKVGVKSARDLLWVCNALRFATREQATAYGQTMYARWPSVREWKVLPDRAPPNVIEAEL